MSVSAFRRSEWLAPILWFGPAVALLLVVTLYPTAVVLWLRPPSVTSVGLAHPQSFELPIVTVVVVS